MKEIKYSLPQLRNEILMHKEDIMKNDMDSLYFDRFIEVGFMDYFIYNFEQYYFNSDKPWTQASDIITDFLQCPSLGDFAEYCYFNRKDIFPLFFRYIEFANQDTQHFIPTFSMIYSWKYQFTLEEFSVYPDYVLHYLMNIDEWMVYLDGIIGGYLVGDLQTLSISKIIKIFTFAVSSFPVEIHDSIFQNIGLRENIPLYDSFAFFELNPMVLWRFVKQRIIYFYTCKLPNLDPSSYQRINHQQLIQKMDMEMEAFTHKNAMALQYNNDYREQRKREATI